MTVTFLTTLADIPKEAELSIFGAGELGTYLAELILNERKDVTIRSFIDSKKAGVCKGFSILNPIEFLKKTEKNHFVVVATHFWLKEVLYFLKGEGFLNIAVSSFVKKGSVFYGSDLEKYGSDISVIEHKLYNYRSKKVWQAVIDGMKGNLSSLIQLFVEHQGPQYLEYVKLQKGDTVVEGGVFDGTNTKQFARIVGDQGKVFAFDPFLNEKLAFPLQVRAEKQALWREKATLFLTVKGAGSSVSPLKTKDTLPVQAVDIDSYMNGRPVEYIKLDVEGAEVDVLKGAESTVRLFRPKLAVSIYHTPEHFFQIPLMLFDMCDDYVFFMESYSPSMGDTILIAIPEEKYKGELSD